MSKTKTCTIGVRGTSISIITGKEGDYISLTDMLRAKDGEFFISDWLRNRNTVEFLGIWESVFNPAFNYGEFAIIKSQAGLNSYKISVKEWVEKTNAIGLKATAGRYGGTFAHPRGFHTSSQSWLLIDRHHFTKGAWQDVFVELCAEVNLVA